MELVVGFVLLLLLIYPYWLIMRFLHLGCKAFKKFIDEDGNRKMPPFVLSYGDEDDH